MLEPEWIFCNFHGTSPCAVQPGPPIAFLDNAEGKSVIDCKRILQVVKLKGINFLRQERTLWDSQPVLCVWREGVQFDQIAFWPAPLQVYIISSDSHRFVDTYLHAQELDPFLAQVNRHLQSLPLDGSAAPLSLGAAVDPTDQYDLRRPFPLNQETQQ